MQYRTASGEVWPDGTRLVTCPDCGGTAVLLDWVRTSDPEIMDPNIQEAPCARCLETGWIPVTEFRRSDWEYASVWM